MKVSKKQKNKFIEAARETECSDDEAEFDQNLKRIAKQKPKSAGHPSRKSR